MKTNNCPLCDNNNFVSIRQTVWPIVKCLYCQLVQVNPLPEKNEILKLYQGDVAENYAPYLSQIQTHRKYFNDFIINMKKLKPKAKLLDIGCALGPLLEEANKYGYDAEGTDVTDYAVNYCHKIGLKVIKGGIDKVNKKNRYDIITAFDTIEHEHDPIMMVKTTYQLLENKGLAVFTTPNYDSVGRKLLGKFWPGYRHSEHLFFFTPQTLTALFKQAGFVNIKVTIDPMRPYPISYWFRRATDYFPIPIIKDFFILISKLSNNIQFALPFNPWGNIMIYGEKT